MNRSFSFIAVLVSNPILMVPAAVGVMAPASVAVAQAESYEAVATEATAIRCGDTDRYYAIAQLAPGQSVTVFAEARGWAQVGYPEGVGAYVTAEDGQPSGSGQLVLTGNTRLRAPSATGGPSASWKPLLNQELPSGTVLQLLETVQSADGRSFYLVQPPASARAFVRASALRRAMPSETAQAQTETQPQAATGSNALPDPVQTQPDTQPETQAATQADTPATQPEQATTPDQNTQAETGTGEVIDNTNLPAAPTQRPRLAPVIEQLRSLENSFDSIRADDAADSAAYNELIGAFQSLAGELSENPATASLVGRVQRSIDVLELQRDIREQLAESEAEAVVVGEELARIQAKLAEQTQTAGFDVIGSLLVSSVYDGQRLPLLYRIQSVGETVPRTIAYVDPSTVEGIDLAALIGRTVGIAGVIERDRSTGLRLFQISKIEGLDASLLD